MEIQIFAGIAINGHDYYERYRSKSIKAFLKRISYEYEFEYGARAIAFKVVDGEIMEVYFKEFKQTRSPWHKLAFTKDWKLSIICQRFFLVLTAGIWYNKDVVESRYLEVGSEEKNVFN